MRIKRSIILPLCVTVLATLAGYTVRSRFITPKGTVQAESVPGHLAGVRLIPFTLPHEYDGYGFSSVALVDGGDIWAVGYNGHDPRRICHYKNDQDEWEVVTIPSPGFVLQDISFPDPQNGWAVGGYGTVMHTSDGGKSWEQLARPTTANLTSLAFVSDKVGYIGGSTGLFDKVHYTDTYGVVIMRTTDGGLSWVTSYEDSESERVGQIAALSDNIAIAFSDRVLRTEDGGNTWQPISIREASRISFNAEGIGYGVSMNGGFYRSFDKGKTWETMVDLPKSLRKTRWWSIDFADEIHGMAIGEGGAVAVTSDDGKTWSEVKTGIQENLMKVRLHGRSGLVLGSQKVYRVAGL